MNNQRLNDALRAFMASPADELRPALEKLVEELIAAMDAADGDPDLEPDNDNEPDNDGEPWLGSFDRQTNQEHAWRERWGDWPYQDFELDDCDREDDAMGWGYVW